MNMSAVVAKGDTLSKTHRDGTALSPNLWYWHPADCCNSKTIWDESEDGYETEESAIEAALEERFYAGGRMPKCCCECECENVATKYIMDYPLCDGCSEVQYDREGEFLGCGTTMIGKKCRRCEEHIDWYGEFVPSKPSARRFKLGSCKCGKEAWRAYDDDGFEEYEFNEHCY